MNEMKEKEMEDGIYLSEIGLLLLTIFESQASPKLIAGQRERESVSKGFADEELRLTLGFYFYKMLFGVSIFVDGEIRNWGLKLEID